jgi:hypothetical protein
MKLDCIVFARRALVIVPACALLGGCMSSSPIWDAHFGESVRAITQAQIIDPQAGEHRPSKPGIDGKSAVSAMTTYDRSFQAPVPAANPFVIGIGTSAGGGGQ